MSGTCVRTNITCNDNNLCTTDSCVNVAGQPVCVNSLNTCNDNNLCTIGNFEFTKLFT